MAGIRAPRTGALRQAAGPGGSVDPQGRGGPPHPQRRPRASARAPASRTRRAPRARGQRLARTGRRPALRQARRRTRTRRQALRRQDRGGRLLDHHPAWRPHRHHRPQRRRQDHAAEADPGRDDARQRQHAHGHQRRGRLFRPDARPARRERDAGGHHQPGQRVGGDRRHAQARHELSGRLPVLAGARRVAGAQPVGRRTRAPAAGAVVRTPGQRAGAGRAHQRPGYRNAGTIGRAVAGILGHRAAGQPRPRLPEQRRHADHCFGRRRPLA